MAPKLLTDMGDGCIKTGAYVYNACHSVMYYGDLFKRGDIVIMRVCDAYRVTAYTDNADHPAGKVHAVLLNYAETFDFTPYEENAPKQYGTLIAYMSTVRLLTYEGIEWSVVKPCVANGTIINTQVIGGIQLGKEEQTN